MQADLNQQYDVVVVGGGIVGLCIAWFLAEADVGVVCIDYGENKGSIANAGSLHVQMQSRLLRMFPERIPDYEKTQFIYPRAVEYWQEIAERLNENIELKVSGGLMIADDMAQLDVLREKVERERRCNIDTRLLSAEEVAERAPYLNKQIRGASFCPLEGKVNPLLANAAILRKVLAAGATLRAETPVIGIETVARGYQVRTESECFEVPRIVIAAGSGSTELAGMLGFNLPARAEPLHMNITDAAEPFMQHLIQHAARPITMKQMQTGQLVIGGGWPAAPGEGRGAPQVVMDSLLGNLGLASEIVPGIGNLRLIRSWAGINPTVDLLSVIGQVESRPGVFVAVPGDAGYTLGPYCAQLLCDTLLGRQPEYALDLFSPSRFD